MPDYGHELRFGSFITPQNQTPEAVVALARLSEQAGLDLVTFQDHPYQPGFLDTWTLLGWVAAQTSRIHVAGNVLNLALRPPAVLARSVASLDLLSGGRVDLGLGAGAFPDGVAAMGGPRRSPGAAVDALSEAIDIIRGIWSAGERRPLHVDGTHYRVDGARRGPAPAHDVPIWVGAYKPRMLRLVGTKADGWLPSLGYIEPAGIAGANKIIDEAAEEAGRHPREIRRLLNIGPFGGMLQGPVEAWADELLPLAVEDGISTFILGSDDPSALRAFAEEVAPALREAVAAERAGWGVEAGPARGTAALSRRHPGIDYDAVPESLQPTAVEPGDREYARVRSTYVWRGSPGLVLRPAEPLQVAAALAFARRQDVPLAVRSGGHGISGRSTNDGGIVVDLGDLNTVEVLDVDRRLVRVGAGARWGDVAHALAPYGLAISSGDYGDVGVGGLATAGGLGFLSRSYGLTIDHVSGADVVLADGRAVRADADHHPDLFWALRGAGANMGIVTSFDIEAAPVNEVVFAVVVQAVSDPATFLSSWGALVERSPRRLTAFLYLLPGREGEPMTAQTIVVWAGDDTDHGARAIQPFLSAAPVLQQQAQVVPYAEIMTASHNEHHGRGAMRTRSALVDHLDGETASLAGGVLESGEAAMLQVRAVGAAVNDLDPAATAYAHRTKNFSLTTVAGRAAGTGLDDAVDRLSSGGLYLSFESHPDETALTRAFPGETLRRLRRIKAAYDPDNLFRHNFPITPARDSD